MKRTRKWTFVAQEARRLADLGLSGYAIAKQLGVNEGTVSRWVKSGKLVLKRAEMDATRAEVVADGGRKTPEEWAATVRETYALDATDDQLVTMGQAALTAAHDTSLRIEGRLSAMGRFQTIVKQLALVARTAEAAAPKPEPEPKKRPPFRVVRRASGDPRRALMAVSE